MSGPDFERMTKDEVVAWFATAEDISPVLSTATEATEAVRPPGPDGPMMLASIRLPVRMVEQLDSIADLRGVRRSDVIRDALVAWVREQISPVGRDEAERALDVLRKIVAAQPGTFDQAA